MGKFDFCRENQDIMNVTAERNRRGRLREKERRRFFVAIAAKERDVPKTIRLLQIKNYN